MLAKLALLATLAAPAFAHLYISDPLPNSYATESGNYKTPLTAPGGGSYPCKGFINGPSAATWAAGSQQKTVVEGTATHGGGSCQVSLSYDNGATFKVMKSWIGECPIATDGNRLTDEPMPLDFTVPDDAPPGEAVFAWTWFNRIGNREMYMNCATVTITGSGTGTGAFTSLPEIFKANIGNGCSTLEGTAVEFPDPGPDVVRSGGETHTPPGTCGPVAAPGGAAAPASVQPTTQANNAAQEAPAPAVADPAPAPATTKTCTKKRRSIVFKRDI